MYNFFQDDMIFLCLITISCQDSLACTLDVTNIFIGVAIRQNVVKSRFRKGLDLITEKIKATKRLQYKFSLGFATRSVFL